MKPVKTIINYILAVIIAITFILFLVINLTSSTILNKNYILSKLEETDYYNKIYEEVKSNFENYIHQSGLDESVLEGIISQEKVKKDTQIIINNLYDGSNEKIDTQEIEDNLNENIEKTLDNSKLVVTQKNAINTLIDKICTEYKTTMSHYQYEESIHKIYTKVVKYMDIGKNAILVVMVVAILILMVINIKEIYRVFQLVGVSLTIGGSFFTIVMVFFNSKIRINTILILNETISYTLRYVLTEIVRYIRNYGYIMLVAGILLILLSNLIDNIRRNKSET